ncbi:MAG: type VI secretion system tip protein VgrG [Deltaproteobacteria bacterium]|nr:type VI secretion system tip protein VgrG [Deltaproteobacteria bacterium]
MTETNPIALSLSFKDFPSLSPEVIEVSGRAGLNEIYEVRALICLKLESLEQIELDSLLSSPASLLIESLAIKTTNQPSAWQGTWGAMVTSMSLRSQVGPYLFLEIILGPKLAGLIGQRGHRIHLGRDFLEIIADSLMAGGLSADSFEIKVQDEKRAKRDFVFHYDQDLSDFIFSIMEREGLAYYFKPNELDEILTICNTKEEFYTLFDNDNELVLTQRALSGLAPIGERYLYDLVEERINLPRSLILSDYDWEKPNLPLTLKVTVCEKGIGEIHLHGEHFHSLIEAKRLSQLRKEALISNSLTYQALCTAPGLKPGARFTLSSPQSPEPESKRQFFVVSATFFGSQAGLVSRRLKLSLGEDKAFSQTIRFRPFLAPFRPMRKHFRPKISGSLTAFIDGALSGQNPELDQYGRYKVLLPLDLSQKHSGQASAWIRLAQPMNGAGYGMHFPMTPGAEVILTFIDGNPDRPVIAAALPNAESVDPIGSKTADMSALATKGGSGLFFHNQGEKQKALLGSGSSRGFVSLISSSPAKMTAQVDATHSAASRLKNMATLIRQSLAGHAHSVVVGDSTTINNFMSTFAMTKSLASSVKSAIQGVGDPQSTGDKYVSNVSANYLEFCDFALGAFYSSFNSAFLIQSFLSELGPLATNDNLIRLQAGPKGAKALFRSGKASPSGFINVFQLITMLASLGGDVAIDIKANPLSSKSQNFALKKINLPVAAAASAVVAIAQIVSFVAATYAMNKAKGDPKGLVIKNLESYLSMRSRNFASLSGDGPVIIESSPSSIGEILNLGARDSLTPLSILSRHSSDNSPQSFDTTKAVLLLSSLVRSLADEINLEASKAFIAKSKGLIEIIVGQDEGKRAAREAAQTAINGGYDLYLTKDDSPPRKAAEAAVLNGAIEQYKNYDLAPMVREVTKGILSLVLNLNSKLILQTLTQDSEIKIILGLSSLSAPTEPLTMIELSSAGSLYKATNVARLNLNGPQSKVELTVNQTSSLTLEGTGLKTAKLEVNSTNVNLADNLSFTAQEKINFSCETSAIELNGVNVSLSSGAKCLVADSLGLKLGPAA